MGTALAQLLTGVPLPWGDSLVVPSSIAGLQFWGEPDHADNALGTFANLTAGVPDFTQANASKQPAFDTLSGRQCWLHDGVDDFFKSTFAGDLAQPNTLFFVVERDAVAGAYRLCDGLAATGKRHLVDYTATDALQAYAGTVQTSAAGVLGTGRKIITAVFDGANSIFRVNGTQVLAGDTGAQAISGLVLGIDDSETLLPFKGKMGDFLIYNARVSNADILRVEARLTTRWPL